MLEPNTGTSGKGEYQQTKKRRTIGLFGLRCRHQDSNNGFSNASPHMGGCNCKLTTPASSCCCSNYYAVENASVASKNGTSSITSSVISAGSSVGPAPVGLPDFIINIPPIPDLRDSGSEAGDDNCDSRRTTALPTIRSLRAISRYISPSTG